MRDPFDGLAFRPADKRNIVIADVRQNPVVKEPIPNSIGDLLSFGRVAFRELNLRHLLDDLPITIDLVALAGDADHADHVAVDLQRIIAALQRALVFAVVINEQFFQPFRNELRRAGVISADSSFCCAGHNHAVFIEEIQLLLQDACQTVNDILGELCRDRHQVYLQTSSHGMLYYSLNLCET